VPHGHNSELLRGWAGRVTWMCAAVGWENTALTMRRHVAGTTLAFTAPPAALMSATALNEWSLEAAAEEYLIRYDASDLEPERLHLDQPRALVRLREMIAEEAATPPADAAPIPERAIPIVLVTGSNGKTTTTRLIAAMLRAAGHVVGFSCTDGVFIGTEEVERGDWSGPGGARRVLEDARVTAAVLESARGGMLRRGIVAPHADVVVVTNVAADHFGDYGIHSLEDIAELKTSLALVLRPQGTLVLNGDDPLLNPASPSAHLSTAAKALPSDRRVTFSLESPWPATLPVVTEIPITAKGAARFNIANILAATAAARALGVSDEAIASTLTSFGEDPRDNAGRLMRLEVGGVTVIIDYAHNPHGLGALLKAARAMASGRLLLLLGQAGDRDDDAIRALTRTAWEAQPALVVLKDLDGYLRGRAPGAIPALMSDELQKQGAHPDQLLTVLDEMGAARTLLERSRLGDLLVLPVHALEARNQLLALLERLQVAGWSAGHPLPH
jgi:cyanophycin synthetase